MSAPQSVIYICSGVRLDPRYVHTVYFANQAAQVNYFASKVVKSFAAYTYLRKNWPLQVEATMEQAKTWSYLYFYNGTSGKYYYYFITQVQYKNDNTVELTLELDVLQTYLFDFSLKQCFVERQHVVNDYIGRNTIDEGLEIGELKDVKIEHWSSLTDMCILVMATFNPNYADTTTPVPALAYNYNGVFSGVKIWAVNSEHWQQWGSKLDDLSEAGFLDGIIAMWMYPKELVVLGGEDAWDSGSLCKVVNGVSTSKTFNFAPNLNQLDGYTPSNAKLFCYPYNMLYVTNNNGGAATYRFERFPDTELDGFSAKFSVYGCASPDGTIRISPVSYNLKDGASGGNYDHGLVLGGFPSCAWDADVYKMWLAQNQNQHAYTMATGGITAVAGIGTALASAATGNVVGAVGGLAAGASGLQQISGLVAQKADMAIQPPQARGNLSSNVNVAVGRHTFSFYQKCVTYEQARVIDDYFTMYGYRINRVQTPNIHARQNWTYVKTVGCTIQANMCTEDVLKIESIFDNGITWWTDGDQIGLYSRANPTL